MCASEESKVKLARSGNSAGMGGHLMDYFFYLLSSTAPFNNCR
jgi:hypothetical protein